MQKTDIAIIHLAFCDAAAEILQASTNQALQAAAQINTNAIKNIREAIKSGTAKLSTLESIDQINMKALSGVNMLDPTPIWEKIQQIRDGK